MGERSRDVEIQWRHSDGGGTAGAGGGIVKGRER